VETHKAERWPVLPTLLLSPQPESLAIQERSGRYRVDHTEKRLLHVDCQIGLRQAAQSAEFISAGRQMPCIHETPPRVAVRED
jgi:hypothetical protein